MNEQDIGSGWGNGPDDIESTPADSTATPADTGSATPDPIGASPPPVSDSTPSTTTAPAPGAAISPTGGAVPAPAAAAPTPFSLLNTLRGQGYDTSRYKDDQHALEDLIRGVRQGREAQQMAQYGQLYLQHQDQFQKYLTQQGQPAQPPAPQGWQAPSFDPSWEHQVRRDENGNIVPIPGAPPDVVPKFLQWQAHRNQTVNQFAQDPAGFLKEHINKLVEPMMQERVNQALDQYKQKTYAESTLNQAQSWMFQTDQQGQPLLDPYTGQKSLSQAGQLYKRNVDELAKFNPQDMQQLDTLARRLATGEIAYSIQKQTAVPAPAPALPVPGHQPNHSGSVTPPARATRQAPAQNGSQSFRQMLEQNMRLNGVMDADVDSRN